METVTAEPAMREVEVRCPVGPRRLFAKLRLNGEQPTVTSDNLMEMTCQDCKRRHVNSGDAVRHVLHRYNILGELVETEVVYV